MRALREYPVIALDFDGTCVTHAYPSVGEDIGAVDWLRKWTESGAHLVLWTMRDGLQLHEARQWFKANKIPLWGCAVNPEQADWTSSQKCYAKLYLDDHGFGVPLIYPLDDDRPYVDWAKVGPAVLAMLGGEAD